MHLIDLPDYFSDHYSYAEQEGFYYRTDHHWNMKGAFIGYQEIMNQMEKTSSGIKVQAKDADDFIIDCNNEAAFVGSRNIQLYGLIDARGEQVCRYLPNKINLSEFSAIDRNGNHITDFNKIFGSGLNNKKVSYTDLFHMIIRKLSFRLKIQITDVF